MKSPPSRRQSVAADKAKQAASTVADKVGHGDSGSGTHAADTGSTGSQSGTSGPPLS